MSILFNLMKPEGEVDLFSDKSLQACNRDVVVNRKMVLRQLAQQLLSVPCMKGTEEQLHNQTQIQVPYVRKRHN